MTKIVKNEDIRYLGNNSNILSFTHILYKNVEQLNMFYIFANGKSNLRKNV